MKRSIKNLMRNVVVLMLSLCMIAPLLSPFSEVDAESEATTMSMNDEVAYKIDLSSIKSQGATYILAPVVSGVWEGTVDISFDYYLVGATGDRQVYVSNPAGGSWAPTGYPSNCLPRGQHSFNYSNSVTVASGESMGVGIAVDASSNACTLYIWNVSIKYAGVEKFNAHQSQVSNAVSGVTVKDMLYSQIPFPAYEIDFSAMTTQYGEYYLIENTSYTGDFEISFDYYLVGATSDRQVYVSGSFATYPDNCLKRGQGTFSSSGNGTKNKIALGVDSASNVCKLYVWNVVITCGGTNIFNPHPSYQTSSGKTVKVKDMTYQEIPFPAYMIDFNNMPSNGFYSLTSVTYGNTAEIKVSFKYYLTGATSSKLYMMNAAGGNYIDETTSSKYLQEGEHTFSYKGTPSNSTIHVGIQADGAGEGKLFIWDVEITQGGTSIFSTSASQICSEVKTLIDSGTVFLTEITTYDIPLPDGARSSFDEENIIARFGVVSDVHLSGSWNSICSRAKFAHMIDVFQKVADTDGDGTTELDALLINGDLVDAVANNGSNVLNTTTYGTKAQQNFYEANLFAQGLWGGDNGKNTYTNVKTTTTTGYGNGLASNVKLLYSLGNHDEDGAGIAEFTNTSYETVYSGYYFAAIVCGWQNTGDYKQYITDVVDYYTKNKTTIVVDDAVDTTLVTDTDSAFETAYKVALAGAVAKFHQYYGHDLEAFDDTEGLFYGNRYMKIGDMHCAAIELSTSATSIAFLEEICKTSVAENPNKPIFVMTHYKVSEEMPGAVEEKMATEEFRSLLKKYPQIIIWGGHSHTYLHSDEAIDTSNGYVAVDSGVVAYAAQTYLTMNALQGNSTVTSNINWAVNAATKDNQTQSTGCYVEVDSNYNVRIKKVDLYRSYSTEYVDTDKSTKTYYLYHDGANTNQFRYMRRAADNCEPVDDVVFIRDAWDITDIGSTGKHLLDYTSDRAEKAGAPVLTEEADVSLTAIDGKIKAKIVMDATVDNADGDTDTDDGLVYMYVVELYKADDESLVERMYYTNGFYDYANTDDIPARSAQYIFEDLADDTAYNVKMYPVSEYGVVGEAITKTATTRTNSMSSFGEAYVIDFAGADVGGFYTLTNVPGASNKTVKISFDYSLEDGEDNIIKLFDVTSAHNSTLGTFDSNTAQTSGYYLESGTHRVEIEFTGSNNICLALQHIASTYAKLYIWNVDITVGDSSVFSTNCQQQSTEYTNIPILTTITFDEILTIKNDITGDFIVDVKDLVRMKKYDVDTEKDTFCMHRSSLYVENAEDMREYLLTSECE